MPAETLLPDAILQIDSPFSGSIADLTDDPAAPDGLWIVSTNNDGFAVVGGAPKVLRVSFPSPAETLTLGPGLQTIRLWLRRAPTGGNDPSYRIDLFESGLFVATIQAQTTLISTAGVLVTVAWDAALLSDPTGAGAEVAVNVWRSSGATGTRRVVEIGAIAWDVVHNDPPPEPGGEPGPPATECRDRDRLLGWSAVIEGTEGGTLRYRTQHARSDATPVLGIVAASIEGSAAQVEVHERAVPRDIVGARVVLSAEYGGRVVPVLDGVVTAAAIGEAGESTTLTLGYADGAPSLWSPSQAVVEGSHPGPLPGNPTRYRPVGSEGARYPIVYGYPGENQVRGTVAGARPVVPLYLSEMSALAGPSFAGPLLDGRFTLDAQAVVWGQLSRRNTYWSDTTVPGDAIELVENAAGDPYWRVRGESGFSATYPVLVAVGAEYQADQLAVGYSSLAGYGGGVREDGVVVSSVVGAAAHLLRAAGLPFDAQRSARAASQWAGYRVDAWVDTDVDAREVVRGWVGDIGGSLERGPDGYWLRCIPAKVSESDVRWRLTEGVDCERTSKLSPSAEQPLGELVVQYAPAFGEYLERVTIRPDAEGAVYGHGELSRSARAESRTLAVPWTFDLSTAMGVAGYAIAAAQPTVTAAYAVPSGDPLAWRVGDGVAVDGRLGVVIGVDIASVGLSVTIRLQGR